MTRYFYAKSVNITMKTLSEDYFLYLEIKRLVSPHLIQVESIEPWMYVRWYLTIFAGKNWVLLNSVQELLFGCFWTFFICLHNQLSSIIILLSRTRLHMFENVICQIDSKNEWLFLLASLTAKFLLVLS